MVDDDAEDPQVRSPLHDRHEALGAKFAGFGGWTMPLEYPTGVVAEHTAVRSGVGVFDVSHLGKVSITGEGAADLVDRTLTNSLAKIRPGKAQYTLCCEEGTGGIVDDLIAYLYSEQRLLLMPNAANAAEVVRRLRAEAPPTVEVTDRHREYAAIAVQGPHSDAVLAALGLPTDHEFMSLVEAPLPGGGGAAVVCRTGYTGERGYELLVPADLAGETWDRVLAAGDEHGIVPCGLGARDTLRTEMGYPLHGQDLSREVTPSQARLGFAVGWRKERFWGREAILAEREAGPARTLRGLRAAGRGIPRPGMAVTLADGTPVAEVTSGTFSPTLRTGIGLALLPTTVAEGEEVLVDVRGRSLPFTVVKPPFVTASTS